MVLIFLNKSSQIILLNKSCEIKEEFGIWIVTKSNGSSIFGHDGGCEEDFDLGKGAWVLAKKKV